MEMIQGLLLLGRTLGRELEKPVVSWRNCCGYGSGTFALPEQKQSGLTNVVRLSKKILHLIAFDKNFFTQIKLFRIGILLFFLIKIAW
jgi:hypothetical protein